MPTRPALALTLVGILAVVTGVASAQTAAVITDPVTYEVYRAVVPTVRDGKPVERIALLDETRFNDCGRQEQTLAPEWRPVLADFRAQNARVRRYQPAMLDFGVPVQLVSLDAVIDLLKAVGWGPGVIRGGWSDAFESLPNGRLVALSAVGLNSDKTLALVTVADDCGTSGQHRSLNDCHQGDTLALRKREGRWDRVSGRAVPGCGWIR